MLRLSSDNAIYDFCKKAVENGLDIFRVFDSLNYIGVWSNIDCIRSTDIRAENVGAFI